jgi:hypothetical protein
MALLVAALTAAIATAGPWPGLAWAADKKGPTYDPNKLLDEGKNGGEVFDAEPRDEFWADVVEQVLGEQITKDLRLLVPGADVGLRCKTLSCVVAVAGPADKRAVAVAVARLIMLGPSLVELTPDDKGTLRWIFFCEPRMRDVRQFVQWYRRTRKQTLAEIRAGKRPNPLPFPVDKLPKE